MKQICSVNKKKSIKNVWMFAMIERDARDV